MRLGAPGMAQRNPSNSKGAVTPTRGHSLRHSFIHSGGCPVAVAWSCGLLSPAERRSCVALLNAAFPPRSATSPRQSPFCNSMSAGRFQNIALSISYDPPLTSDLSLAFPSHVFPLATLRSDRALGHRPARLSLVSFPGSLNQRAKRFQFLRVADIRRAEPNVFGYGQLGPCAAVTVVARLAPGPGVWPASQSLVHRVHETQDQMRRPLPLQQLRVLQSLRGMRVPSAIQEKCSE